MTQSFEKLIADQRVIVLIGAGGVGKTTTAVAVAIAAAKIGRKVALLSIDPAKRLASALGISLGNTLRPLPFVSEYGMSGSIDAAMLEQKAVFDGMVRKHAPSPHIADKILKDPLYLAASTSLGGPLEYMALAKLQELVEDPKYDLVVLDTPPDTQALDFLSRPNVLGAFMENKVIATILRPAATLGRFGLTKVMVASEKLLGGVSSLTGITALARFGEFILLMQQVIEGFHKAGDNVVKTMKNPSTSFVLVTTPTSASARSAIFFSEKLKSIGYSLDAVIFNKSLSKKIKGRLAPSDADSILAVRAKGEMKTISYVKDAIQKMYEGREPVVKETEENEENLTDLRVMVQYAHTLL